MLQRLEDRYLEEDKPERFKRYLTTKVITDPLKVAVGAMAVAGVDAIIEDGGTINNVALVVGLVSGGLAALGGLCRQVVVISDAMDQQQADLRQQRMQEGLDN